MLLVVLLTISATNYLTLLLISLRSRALFPERPVYIKEVKYRCASQSQAWKCSAGMQLFRLSLSTYHLYAHTQHLGVLQYM